ncbi:MAG: electron transport complex subunit RsxC [Sedimenticolaceae bacterium]
MSALKDFFSRGFAHGVHPQGFKEHTADLPTQRMPFVGRYVMPLNQHLGAPAIPLVAVGDRVRRGQLIAEPGAFVSTSLHSPVTGRVRAIANRRFPGGVFARSIEIETDPYATQRLEQRPAVDWRDLTKDEFVAQVQHAGIVGMGGAAFPSHVKYSIPEGQHIDHVLVNGAECEPFLTNDHRLMVERPEALLHGIEILLHNLGAREATIGVELNKPQAIAALEQHLKPSQAISVVPLQVKYPQGAEKMLIKAVYGKEVPAGELPRDLGIAVNNVGTVVAIADWFEAGVPLIERIVTVSGPGVQSPSNLIVPLGTPVREVLRYCGGLKDGVIELVMGGPMMGMPIASLDVPVLKGTSGILAFTEAGTSRPKEYPCIRCGRCLEACPYFLNPSRLARLSKARLFEEMKNYSVMDCVECGSCTYACPSRIPIVQLIRTAKSQLRQPRSDDR